MSHVNYLAEFEYYMTSTLMTLFKHKFSLDQSESRLYPIANGVWEIRYVVKCNCRDLDPTGRTFIVKVEKNDTLRTLDFFIVDSTTGVGRQGAIYHYRKNTISGELKFCGVDESGASTSGLAWMFGSLMAAYLAWEAWYGFYDKPGVEAHPVVVLVAEDAQEQEWAV